METLIPKYMNLIVGFSVVAILFYTVPNPMFLLVCAAFAMILICLLNSGNMQVVRVHAITKDSDEDSCYETSDEDAAANVEFSDDEEEEKKKSTKKRKPTQQQRHKKWTKTSPAAGDEKDEPME